MGHQPIKRNKVTGKSQYSLLTKLMAVIVPLGVAIVGVHVYTTSHASAPNIFGASAINTGLVTAPASIQADSGAFNGKYVAFGPGAMAVSFSVHGNAIMRSDGIQFVPYGVVIACAAYVNTMSNLCQGNSTDPSGNTGIAVIDAAAKDWHANIVRLQVSQEDLYGDQSDTCTSNPGGATPNAAYVGLVDSLVNEANNLGMVATVTLQEELAGGCAFPTASSTTFWQFMANHFKNNPRVFFDLYNEPQLGTNAAGGNPVTVWDIWQNGGLAYSQTDQAGIDTNLPKVNYVGMQSLINTIRAQGANNIIIAESNNKDQDLSGLPTHVLSGSNVAYGIEPNLHNATASDLTAKEDTTYGQYASNWPIVPEAFLNIYGDQSCDADSPIVMPLLLNYLHAKNTGLIFWALDPGVAIVGTDLNHPTSYPAGQTSILSANCPNKGSGSGFSRQNTIGYGAVVQAFYKSNSVQLP